MVLYARLGLALVRSLRSLWHAHCVRFGTLTAFALARSLRSLWYAPFGRFCMKRDEEAEVGTLQKRAQRAYKRPKAVPKGEARTKVSKASEHHLRPSLP